MKALILGAILLSGCTSAYVERQHGSSAPNGKFPSWNPGDSETEWNTLGIGVRRDYSNGLYFDGSLHWQLYKGHRSDLEGRDPYFIGKFGWTFWEKK